MTPGMLADAHRREPRVHVAEVLLGGSASHARADDVEEGQDPGLRGVDDLRLELREAAPAGATHVHERGLPAAEGVTVGRHRHHAVAEIGVRFGAVKHVGMQVDEAWHHVQALGIDDLPRLGRVDGRGDLGDLPVGDRDVHHAVAAILRVEDMAALEDHRVGLGDRRRGARRDHGRKGREGQGLQADGQRGLSWRPACTAGSCPLAGPRARRREATPPARRGRDRWSRVIAHAPGGPCPCPSDCSPRWPSPPS